MTALVPLLFALTTMVGAGPGLPGTCIGCDFAGRDLHGANLRGVLAGDALRQASRSNLAGALL